jgi:hypothetical protein
MSKRKRAPRPARMFGYTVAIAVNAILWYVVHNLQRWDLPFIVVEQFRRVLTALDLSLGATMVANAIFIAYDPRWFRRIGQAALNLLSLNAMYAIYRVFPFDFGSAGADQAIRSLMVLGMIAVGIGAVVELARLPFGRED